MVANVSMMSDMPVPSRPVGALFQELDMLQAEVAVSRGLMGELEERLHPILTPVQSGDIQANTQTVQGSVGTRPTISVELAELTRRLSYTNDRIRNKAILGSLEI